MKKLLQLILLACLLTSCGIFRTKTKTATDSTVYTNSETKADWKREVTRQYTFLPPSLDMPEHFPYLPVFDTSRMQDSEVFSSSGAKGGKRRSNLAQVHVTETIRESGKVSQQAETKKQVQIQEKNIQKAPTKIWPWISGILLLILFLVVVFFLKYMLRNS